MQRMLFVWILREVLNVNVRRDLWVTAKHVNVSLGKTNILHKSFFWIRVVAN